MSQRMEATFYAFCILLTLGSGVWAVFAQAQEYPPLPEPLVTPYRIMDARWSGGYLIVSCEGGVVYRSNLAGGYWQGLARLGDVPPSRTHWRLFAGPEHGVGELWGYDEHRVVRVYEGDR